MASESIIYDQRDAIVTLRLNRPDVRNAVDDAMVAQLNESVARLADDTTVRAVILAGEGAGFSAGADLNGLARATPDQASEMIGAASDAMNRLASLPVPVIAAMHGFALGGGFLLSLYCDVRVVADDAKIGLPAAARMWMLPWAMSRLASWIGVARAQQLVLAGGVMTPQEAKRLGLVDHVVPTGDVQVRADELARDLAGWPRHVLKEVRGFFSELEGREHADWDRRATAAFVRCFAADEAQQVLEQFRGGVVDPPPSEESNS